MAFWAACDGPEKGFGRLVSGFFLVVFYGQIRRLRLIEKRGQLLFFAMFLVAVVMPGTVCGFDVITQMVPAPMPMLHLTVENRPGVAVELTGPKSA